MRLKIKAVDCSICNLCAIACAFKNTGELKLSHSAVRINPQFPDSLAVRINFCSQCPQGYCLAACSPHALNRLEDGRVVLTPELCDTCQGEYRCVSACKSKGIYKPSDGTPPIKCDVCDGAPECAKVCPWQLISIV
jgi:anaerobic carbon-monoxide dehydrogenase iron sulfur subunit